MNVAGLIGQDTHGKIIRELFHQLGVNTNSLVISDRRTTTKIRILGGNQQMVRLDFEDTSLLNKEGVNSLINFIDQELENKYDAILLSDYNKGICSDALCRYVIKEANHKKIPVFVDPKGKNWEKYEQADYITPNLKELSDVTGIPVSNEEQEITRYALETLHKFNLRNILVTRSEKGMTLVNDSFIHTIPTEAKEVFDVSGAGDTVIASFAVGIAGGLSPVDASFMADFAAGIGVSKVGTYAVSREDILNKLP